jgi:hypothetical protein
MTPIGPVFARAAGANAAQVQDDLDRLPDLLDEVDRLIAHNVIGNERLNAEDFQIGPSIRMLLAMTDIAHLVVDRSAAKFAQRVLADYPEIPPILCADWIPTSETAAERRRTRCDIGR